MTVFQQNLTAMMVLICSRSLTNKHNNKKGIGKQKERNKEKGKRKEAEGGVGVGSELQTETEKEKERYKVTDLEIYTPFHTPFALCTAQKRRSGRQLHFVGNRYLRSTTE